MANKGMLYAIGAYAIWGVFPVYWKVLRSVPAFEIMTHRMVWSLLFLVIILAIKQDWRWIIQVFRSPKILLTVSVAALILGLNWLTYIWAVNAGFIVETSLGYFINPLLSVLLGVVFLKEKLRQWQWIAIGLAGVGVLYLTFLYGALPWIALTLAVTFGIYGLLKKIVALNALHSLFFEMAVLFFPAFIYLVYLDRTGSGAFGHVDATTTFFLAFAGVVTAVPLLLFAAGAQRIPLSTIGILQYIAPTLQFLIGVFVYNELFSQTRLIGFSLIWLALLIYSIEGMFARRQLAAVPSTD